jgi:TonB family protein
MALKAAFASGKRLPGGGMLVPKWALVVMLGVGVAGPQTAAKRIPKVSGAVMGRSLKVRVEPVYPLDARQAGVQGRVLLDVVIGAEGKVESVEAISGPKMLYTAAMDAVRRWEYRPYKLNGAPAEVRTTVAVVFSLRSSLAGQVLPS